jgi:hypothetical protein
MAMNHSQVEALMKAFRIQILLCCVALFSGCLSQQRVEPLYPKDLSGWEGRKGEDGIISREFVLRKNEATDNGKVQIKVIDIIPGDPYVEAGSFLRQARARIQFSRISDGKILCEGVYAEVGGTSLNPEGCNSTQEDLTFLESLNMSAIVTSGINLKEEWVKFTING